MSKGISIYVNARLGFNPIGPHPITATPPPERRKPTAKKNAKRKKV